jgi:hypothetical protein
MRSNDEVRIRSWISSFPFSRDLEVIWICVESSMQHRRSKEQCIDLGGVSNNVGNSHVQENCVGILPSNVVSYIHQVGPQVLRFL